MTPTPEEPKRRRVRLPVRIDDCGGVYLDVEVDEDGRLYLPTMTVLDEFDEFDPDKWKDVEGDLR